MILQVQKQIQFINYQTEKELLYSIPEPSGSATYLFTVCQALNAFLWPQTASISVKIEEIAIVKKEGVIIETSDFKALPGACWIGQLSGDRNRRRKGCLSTSRVGQIRRFERKRFLDAGWIRSRSAAYE